MRINPRKPNHRDRRRACGFQLVPGDIEILRYVYSHRLLRVDNLGLLTSRSDKAVARRLRKLTQHKFLHHYRPTIPKNVYAVGKAAIRVLIEQGIVPVDLIGKRVRNELNEFFLKHETMIADFHVLLTLASQGPAKLTNWKEGSALHDHVSIVQRDGRRRLPVRPDAFFTVEDSCRHSFKKVHYFLEADRSTTTQSRFQDKITAYYHYFQQGKHTKKYGVRTFRVLSIALTPERARNLCETAEKVLPPAARRFYLFGSMRNTVSPTPESIFTKQFISPRDFREDAKHRLIE